MSDNELDQLRELIDMPKRDLRLFVGSDNAESNRLDETRGWSRGELIVEAIERCLTSITPPDLDKYDD